MLTVAALIDRPDEVHEGRVYHDDMIVKRSLEKLVDDYQELSNTSDNMNHGLVFEKEDTTV